MRSVSVLVTTYNSPEALRSVLESLQHQTVSAQQILICDDGSTPSTKNIINVFQNRLPLVHCWQPDTGFRAARCRNLALSKVSCEYLILIDGDCILPSTFIESHLALKQPNKIIAGSRNLLSESESEKFLKNFSEAKRHSAFNDRKFYRLKLGFLRDLRPKNWASVRTCNMSLYSRKMLAINGFDENYVGWGLEDSDLVVRLIQYGLTIRSGRYATCVNHLYHPESDRSRVSTNSVRFHTLLTQNKNDISIKSVLSFR